MRAQASEDPFFLNYYQTNLKNQSKWLYFKRLRDILDANRWPDYENPDERNGDDENYLIFVCIIIIIIYF